MVADANTFKQLALMTTDFYRSNMADGLLSCLVSPLMGRLCLWPMH